MKNGQVLRNPRGSVMSGVSDSQLMHNRRSGIQTWDPRFMPIPGATLKPPRQRYFSAQSDWVSLGQPLGMSVTSWDSSRDGLRGFGNGTPKLMKEAFSDVTIEDVRVAFL